MLQVNLGISNITKIMKDGYSFWDMFRLQNTKQIYTGASQ